MSADWLTDLKFWCQTNNAQRIVRCNVADTEHIKTAAAAAGITDLIVVDPWYIPPPGYALVTNPDGDHIDTAVPEEFFEALGVHKYI